MCVDWLTAMHPTSPPVQGVWSQMPSNLLPDGATVCYFNSSRFVEQVVARGAKFRDDKRRRGSSRRICERKTGKNGTASGIWTGPKSAPSATRSQQSGTDR